MCPTQALPHASSRTAMLLSATFAPTVLADVQWEEDGWLATIGEERLEKVMNSGATECQIWLGRLTLEQLL